MVNYPPLPPTEVESGPKVTDKRHQDRSVDAEHERLSTTLGLQGIHAGRDTPHARMPRMAVPPEPAEREPSKVSSLVSGPVLLVREVADDLGKSVRLREPDKAFYFLGLGVAAALGLIELPVAAAVGVGVAVASAVRKRL